jgi:hypothetical protein
MVPTDTPLDLGTVKLEEAGPAKDQTVPPAAVGTMPNSKGKSVRRHVLPSTPARRSASRTPRQRVVGCLW